MRVKLWCSHFSCKTGSKRVFTGELGATQRLNQWRRIAKTVRWKDSNSISVQLSIKAISLFLRKVRRRALKWGWIRPLINNQLMILAQSKPLSLSWRLKSMHRSLKIQTTMTCTLIQGMMITCKPSTQTTFSPTLKPKPCSTTTLQRHSQNHLHPWSVVIPSSNPTSLKPALNSAPYPWILTNPILATVTKRVTSQTKLMLATTTVLALLRFWTNQAQSGKTH